MIIDSLPDWYHREYNAGKKGAIEGLRARDNPHSIHCLFYHWWKDGFFENIE